MYGAEFKWINCIQWFPSTERTGHTFSSVSDPTTTTTTTTSTTTAKDNGITEDCIGLPSLPDLLDELNNDVDITSLEQLTQSLLQDIARDLEAASEKADCEESIARDQNVSETVVGSSSKDMESSGSSLLNDDNKQTDPLIKDISEYLLLHHNYSAKPTDEPKKIQKTTRCRTIKPKSKLKPKQILPKIDTNNNKKLAPLSSTITQIGDQQQNILYGTFDEDSNCITIVIDDENCSNPTSITNEIIVDTNPDSNNLNIPFDNKIGSFSPTNSLSSGYESHGSPASLDDNDNIWDDRVSELFPSLM